VGAALASLGALRMSSAATATLIEQDSSEVVDGWNITTAPGVALVAISSNNEIYIEKAANFTVPDQGLQISFDPVAGVGSPATLIDFTDEMVQNNTGQAFSGFDFLLLNIGSANATFPGVSNVFAPPKGTGYDYTSVNLNGTGDVLSYTGNQDAGTTSSWGSAAVGDNLLIDAPAGSDFTFKEQSESGGGGTAVPVPAAAWQSLASLAVLGLIRVGRRAKRRLT
jgi:hypothetical protein